MTTAVFALLGLFLVLAQTSILPLSHALAGWCDLLVPLVVYLGLQRRLRDGLPVVLLLGVAMDNLSGAPPGYHLTAYFWIWALVRWLICFLRVANTFMLPVAILGAVLVENLVLLGMPLLLERRPVPPAAFEILIWETLWALLAGPIMVAGFAGIERRLRRHLRQVQERRAVHE